MAARTLRRVAALLGLLGMLTGCRSEGPDVAAPWRTQSPGEYYADTSAPLAPGGRHVLWFGHSLLVTREGWAGSQEPPLDLPALVSALHDAALADGRTRTPKGRSKTFADGPWGFDYWVDGGGQALERVRALAGTPWTHVVGISLMHLLGQQHFARPNLYEWLRPLMREERSVRMRTRYEYRLMGQMHQALPDATWVSYVGPALADNPGTQPSIDERFACIRSKARAQGLPVRTAPVGRAFRLAYQRSSSSPVPLALQHADFLHLRPHGALLAAQVLFLTVHGVKPTGLAVPPRLRGHLVPGGQDAAKERALFDFLADIAEEAVATQTEQCAEDALLPEDRAAAELLQP